MPRFLTIWVPITGLIYVSSTLAALAEELFLLPPLAASHAFAQQHLDQLQAPSIAQKRELCGYYIYDGSTDSISATAPIQGDVASCYPPDLALYPKAYASYHTHGAYHDDFDSEVPSSDDLTADLESGLDGYIATPGGRVWFVSFEEQHAVQLCGLSCVSADPNFPDKAKETLPQSFTPPALKRFLSGE